MEQQGDRRVDRSSELLLDAHRQGAEALEVAKAAMTQLAVQEGTALKHSETVHCSIVQLWF